MRRVWPFPVDSAKGAGRKRTSAEVVHVVCRLLNIWQMLIPMTRLVGGITFSDEEQQWNERCGIKALIEGWSHDG
jgi:hypothetical protein